MYFASSPKPQLVTISGRRQHLLAGPRDAISPSLRPRHGHRHDVDAQPQRLGICCLIQAQAAASPRGPGTEYQVCTRKQKYLGGARRAKKEREPQLVVSALFFFTLLVLLLSISVSFLILFLPGLLRCRCSIQAFNCLYQHLTLLILRFLTQRDPKPSHLSLREQAR